MKKQEKCIYIYICKYLSIHGRMMHQFFPLTGLLTILDRRKGARARKMEITNFLFFLIISRTSSLLEWFLCILLFFSLSISLGLFALNFHGYQYANKRENTHITHKRDRETRRAFFKRECDTLIRQLCSSSFDLS
jgi:hypothetical protein